MTMYMMIEWTRTTWYMIHLSPSRWWNPMELSLLGVNTSINQKPPNIVDWAYHLNPLLQGYHLIEARDISCFLNILFSDLMVVNLKELHDVPSIELTNFLYDIVKGMLVSAMLSTISSPNSHEVFLWQAIFFFEGGGRLALVKG